MHKKYKHGGEPSRFPTLHFTNLMYTNPQMCIKSFVEMQYNDTKMKILIDQHN